MLPVSHGRGHARQAQHCKSEISRWRWVSRQLQPSKIRISDSYRAQAERPTDIVIGRVTYPAGEEMSFAFAPDDKLSVYTGEFPVTVEIRPLAGVLPAKYMIHGELKYQACDNAACYPPKKVPVQFEVKVVKAPPPPARIPGRVPHVHT